MAYCYHCMTKIEDPDQPYCHECGKEYNRHYAQSNELPAGSTLCGERYLVGKSIGSGGFGISYIGFDLRLMKKVLIKETFYSGLFQRNCYDRSSSDPLMVTYPSDISLAEIMRKTQKECSSLSQAESLDNVVKVYDCFSENNTAYIITEFIDGMTLTQKIRESGPYSWNELYTRMKPLMICLQELHEKGILHRDIKPLNIMIKEQSKWNDERFVLIDFGLARSADAKTVASIGIAFSPGYAPFEQRTLAQKDGVYTDVYSLAATIYFAVTGEDPREEVGASVDENFPLLRDFKEKYDVPSNVVFALRYALQPDHRIRCQSVADLMERFERIPKTSQYQERSSANRRSAERPVRKKDRKPVVRSKSEKWICGKCGRKNEGYVMTCGCGNEKSNALKGPAFVSDQMKKKIQNGSSASSSGSGTEESFNSYSFSSDNNVLVKASIKPGGKSVYEAVDSPSVNHKAKKKTFKESLEERNIGRIHIFALVLVAVCILLLLLLELSYFTDGILIVSMANISHHIIANQTNIQTSSTSR